MEEEYSSFLAARRAGVVQDIRDFKLKSLRVERKIDWHFW